MRSLSHLSIKILLAATFVLPCALHAQYAVQDHWKVGGQGGWDYLVADAAAHRLYLAHGPRVEVLDTASGKSIGAIVNLKSTHGVALDAAGKYGYISDGAGNAVVVFDRTTLATVATIPAGTNPDGIVYEPVTKTVWAFNGRSKDATVIDTTTQKVIATIPLPGKPEFPAADGKGTVFVNIEDKNSIARFDAATQKQTAFWALQGCESPSGLAFDAAGRRLFSVCDGNKMAVTDANTGASLAMPAIGDSPDAAGFDAKRDLAFSSNGGDGTLTIVDGKTYKVLQSLPTAKGARTMAFDSATGRVFVVTAQFGPKSDPTPQMPRPRAAVLPDSFEVLVIARQ